MAKRQKTVMDYIDDFLCWLPDPLGGILGVFLAILGLLFMAIFYVLFWFLALPHTLFVKKSGSTAVWTIPFVMLTKPKEYFFPDVVYETKRVKGLGDCTVTEDALDKEVMWFSKSEPVSVRVFTNDEEQFSTQVTTDQVAMIQYLKRNGQDIQKTIAEKVLDTNDFSSLKDEHDIDLQKENFWDYFSFSIMVYQEPYAQGKEGDPWLVDNGWAAYVSDKGNDVLGDNVIVVEFIGKDFFGTHWES